ncbi:MAG: HDOD domain-containing protein [Planctomycetes bacterium]|nr:HDOD domain-containing protein [Planctomycetota bacterium]
MKPRILFVDDESMVLVSIRDMLRKHRNRWDMTFCPSGQAAIAMLRRDHVDIVVSDMRMPNIDGAEVLTRAMELQPHSVRIILSGHTSRDASVRAVKVAHRFLSKPFDSDGLVAIIEEALASLTVDAKALAHVFVGGIEHLPSAPALYFELERLMRNGTAGITEIADLVSKDPAMVAKILQVVNSAFFGLPRHISSIHAACTYLGASTISDLVLAADVFGGAAPEAAAIVDSIQRDGLAAAAIARALVHEPSLREPVATACMLHDVGKLLIALRETHKLTEVESAFAAGQGDWRSLETAAFGFTHVDAGAALIETWGLPRTISHAVAGHHGDLAGDSATPSCAWTHVATLAAENALFRDDGRDAFHGVSPLAFEILGAPPDAAAWRAATAPVIASLKGERA